ncbi:MAG: ABC transporter permease [Puniceicoccales bacterium]|jgi:NitT/TauT family transport system permease protein|nr:ABC transporter permease [Puniceicoccales bacterium]
MKYRLPFLDLSIVKFLLKKVAYLFVILCIWQCAYVLGGCSDLIFPTPFQVARFLWNACADGTLVGATWMTIKRLILGYGISMLIGIPLGMLCSRFYILNACIGKLVLGLQTLPSICWVPLTLLWFGQTDCAILFVVTMGSLWSLIASTESSVRQIPNLYIKAARTMGSRGIDLWLTVIFPAALPFIITGMKQSWAFAWRSLMSAEIYVSTIRGLGVGQLLHYGREMQAMDHVVGIILVIIAIGFIAEKVIFANLERTLHKRWGFVKSPH